MHNLIEYSDNYLKLSTSLCQFRRDEPGNVITESESFKFKWKLLENTNSEGIMIAKTTIPLKLTNFWRTFEMLLTSCGISLILTWLANCVISEGEWETNFAITNPNFYVPIVTLSIKIIRNYCSN